MHFPPDTSLAARDYLASRTSQRWGGLLARNGVRKADAELYEDIVDIASVAVPANAGQELAGTVNAFRGAG